MHWLCGECKDRTLQSQVDRRMGTELRRAEGGVEAEARAQAALVAGNAAAAGVQAVATAQCWSRSATATAAAAAADDAAARAEECCRSDWWERAAVRVKPPCPYCRHAVRGTVNWRPDI